MKIIIFAFSFALLGYTISKPLESSDATDALVEIERQKLIKFPEDPERTSVSEGHKKHIEAKRILQEIEKINQALGYIKKQSAQSRSPAILDSSQYLFPNAGYQPFHLQNSQAMGVHEASLLLPSIRSVKFDPSQNSKAAKYSAAAPNSLYFKPQRVELATTQANGMEKLLPTHFVIPVRLYKENKEQYIEKHNPQEYKIKGYKIVGDIDHFYGKTKPNKTAVGTHLKSAAKYHLFVLPQEILAKSSLKDMQATEDSSKESSSREEKLAHRPYKVQTSAQGITTGNTINATSTSQIVKKRLVAKKGANTNSVVSASSSTVVKVTPTANNEGQPQQQHHFPKPTNNQQLTQIMQPPEATPAYDSPNSQPTKPSNNKAPIRPLLNAHNSDNNNNNNNNNNNHFNNAMKTRPLLELQNSIHSINNATSNAIKAALQNIFRRPLRPQDTNKIPTPPMNQQQQQHQQQQLFSTYNGLSSAQSAYGGDNFQGDHLDSDYRWDDENASLDSSSADYQEHLNTSHDDSSGPEQTKIFGDFLKHKHESEKDVLKQGGIIIQKLKVRKGGIAIAGPGGVATAGSGGTAIVGPGGYALTHPRSLTIAGPGAKVIAIPSHIDLKDALQRTNLALQTFPREGRIVATGPTVYYAPPTGDYVDL